MSGILKRLGKRSDTIEGTGISPQSTSSASQDVNEKAVKDEGFSTATDVLEAEANRKLSVFEKAHRWDPNLDDDFLEDVDDALVRRDASKENKVYDEVFENSPYPEVCRARLLPSHARTNNSRSGQLYATMMRIFLRTLYGHG